MKIKVIASFLLLLITVTHSFSQKKSDKNESQTPLSIKANVYVLNSANQAADDVKIEDLRVFEDGVEQKITYFARKEPVLNLVILGDNTGSMRTQLKKIILIGKSILENLRPNDEALVIRFVSSDKIEKLQEWASNPLLLDLLQK